MELPGIIRLPDVVRRVALSTQLLRRFIAVFVCAISGVVAAPIESLPSTRVDMRILAPEAVRVLLETHFHPPESPFADEMERLAFRRRARTEIADLLATEGYFSPTIEFSEVDAAGAIDILVEPGPQATVATVSIEFVGELAQAAQAADEISRAQQLRAAWSLTPGHAFRSSAWNDAKADLLAALVQQDYAAAKWVESRVDVDVAQRQVALHLVVDSGPACRFGELAIQGLQRYDEDLIRRQLTFRPGEPYRQSRLLAFQTQLQNLPHFSSVFVTVEPDGAQPTLPVRVTVTEAASRYLDLGAGYSSSNGARGEIGYRSHNFLGWAWNLNSGLHLEQNRQKLFADVETLPDDKGYRLVWGGRTEASRIQGLQTQREVIGIARSRRHGKIETRLALDWQAEDRRAQGGSEESTRALVLDWRWNRRDVDRPLMPRQGDVLEVGVALALNRLGSDRDFLRWTARYQYWQPIGERDGLSMRAEVGQTLAQSRFGIPQDYLFRIGGPQSVRGYAYRSLGVREGSAVVGGRAMVSGAAEYTHWLGGDFGLAWFVDSGGAGDAWREVRRVVGYGLGARWRTAAGPLGIDLAYGAKEKNWRLHFAVSVGF